VLGAGSLASAARSDAGTIHGALFLATGSALAMGVVIVLAGATIAPTAATLYAMVDVAAPTHAHGGVLLGPDRVAAQFAPPPAGAGSPGANRAA
jgi:hypothetical protein